MSDDRAQRVGGSPRTDVPAQVDGLRQVEGLRQVDGLRRVLARPRKASKIAIGLAVLIVGVFTAIGLALHGSIDGGRGTFQTGDQIAMIMLGLLGAAGVLLFTRPLVDADEHGIRVRNVLGSYQFPWELVRAVRFGKGAPWATLELQDDDVVAVMAVQAADKAYAVTAVRGLRALLAGHQARQIGDLR